MISIELSPHVEEKLKEMADKAGISTSKLIDLILSTFIDGGTIYPGKWDKGKRIVVAWPDISHKIIKVPFEELKEGK